MKSQVYEVSTQSIPERKDDIIRVNDEIEPQLCQTIVDRFGRPHIFQKNIQILQENLNAFGEIFFVIISDY